MTLSFIPQNSIPLKVLEFANPESMNAALHSFLAKYPGREEVSPTGRSFVGQDFALHVNDRTLSIQIESKDHAILQAFWVSFSTASKPIQTEPGNPAGAGIMKEGRRLHGHRPRRGRGNGVNGKQSEALHTRAKMLAIELGIGPKTGAALQ